MKIPTANLIINLSQIIMPKLRISSLSKYNNIIFLFLIESLFINIIPTRTKLNPSQILRISHIKRENPSMFEKNSLHLSDLGKKICAGLEEFYNYVNAKFKDGTTLFEVNIAIDKRNKIQKKLNVINNKINSNIKEK